MKFHASYIVYTRARMCIASDACIEWAMTTTTMTSVTAAAVAQRLLAVIVMHFSTFHQLFPQLDWVAALLSIHRERVDRTIYLNYVSQGFWWYYPNTEQSPIVQQFVRWKMLEFFSLIYNHFSYIFHFKFLINRTRMDENESSNRCEQVNILYLVAAQLPFVFRFCSEFNHHQEVFLLIVIDQFGIIHQSFYYHITTHASRNLKYASFQMNSICVFHLDGPQILKHFTSVTGCSRTIQLVEIVGNPITWSVLILFQQVVVIVTRQPPPL